MNIKAITRAMELSDDDWELATKLRMLSETERELLTTALGPQKPAAKKSSATTATRKIERCAGELDGDRCDLTRRAAVHKDTFVRGYHEFVPPQQSSRKAGKSRGADRCIYVFPASGTRCDLRADKAIHTEKAHPDYHVFYTGKSARASGMAAAISGSLQRGRGVVTGDSNDGCCNYEADHNIHHLEKTPGYHPFVSSAPSAPLPSDQTSSEIGMGAAGVAQSAGD